MNRAGKDVALAKAYHGTRIAQAAVHHDRLAGVTTRREAAEAAEMHEGLAAIAW